MNTFRKELQRDFVLDRKTEVAEGVVMLTLRDPLGRPVPAWKPGSHIDLILGDELVRRYSLCGDPADRSHLRVAVLREPQSRGGSRYVHDELVEGQIIHTRGPRNNFEFVPKKRYIFIAGGIGITPILPMVALAEERGANWRLVYGGRTRASMAFRDELREAYGKRVVIRPQDEFGLLNLKSLLGRRRRRTAIYCCGPEPLLNAVESAAAHWPDDALHVERFAPKASGGGGADEAFEVELALTGETVSIPADVSLLDAMEDAGVSIMSSCEEGVCGTCEVAVLSGTIDHRDSILTERERVAGDKMMACVSRARGSRLVLDL